MGKMERSGSNRRSKPARKKIYAKPDEKDLQRSEKNLPEPGGGQETPPGLLTPSSSSSLSANLSASGGSLVSAPAFCHNNVSGDVNISFVKENVAITEDRPKKQDVSEGANLLQVFLKFLKKIKKKTQIVFLQRGGQKTPKKGNVTCKRLPFGVRDQLQVVLDEGNEEDGECGHVLGTIAGEVIGSIVTVEYHCYECGTGITRFEATDFRVKCAKCMRSWKCATLECTCTAEITIELSDLTKQTVVLSDPLLRSVVSFEKRGYCNTDNIEVKVLLLDKIRVDFKDGYPNKVFLLK